MSGRVSDIPTASTLSKPCPDWHPPRAHDTFAQSQMRYLMFQIGLAYLQIGDSMAALRSLNQAQEEEPRQYNHHDSNTNKRGDGRISTPDVAGEEFQALVQYHRYYGHAE